VAGDGKGAAAAETQRDNVMVAMAENDRLRSAHVVGHFCVVLSASKRGSTHVVSRFFNGDVAERS
jgi:hypothetical protein